MIGAIAGSFRVIAKISVGGMGTVYRAEHMLIGKPAAVKVLHPELTANKDIVNRFFNEAKATTAIQHPGIVEVFDFGYLPSGHAFLVMEFLEGMTLAQRIKMRGPIHEAEAAVLLRPVCSALSAAHAKGIVHRDLKPDNIFLVEDADAAHGERPKILDFGIAKLTDIGLAGSATKTGAVMGTPTYMSPEQCKGIGEVDHRADLYSLGCILYELVAGRPPFVNRGAGELLGMHLFMQPESPSLHQGGISPEVEQLIMALLSKDPGMRVQSAKELGAHLAAIAQHYGQGTASMAGNPRASSAAFGTNPTLTGPGVPMPTPHFTPHHTPLAATPWQPTRHAQQPSTPTTLSGAASQSVVTPPPRRRGLYIALAAITVCAGIGITVGTLRSSGSGSTASSNPSTIVPAISPPPAVKPPVTPPVIAPAVTPPVTATVTPPVTTTVTPPVTTTVTPPVTTTVTPPVTATVTPPAKPPTKPHKLAPHPDKPAKPDPNKSDLPLATDI